MSVEKLMGVIKQASVGAMEAGAPVAVRIGMVKTVSPLAVVVDQRFTLTAEFLIIPERLTKYEIDVKHAHSYSGGTTDQALPDKLLIRSGLQAGDKVILLRIQGGQQYVILDKVVGS